MGSEASGLSEDSPYLGHSANKAGKVQTLKGHLTGVERRAVEHAAAWGGEGKARLAALLHDIGKYSPRFMLRLRGLEKGLDHWSPGAWLALVDHAAPDIALAVQGHHVGLQKGDRPALRALEPKRLAETHPLGLSLTEIDTDALKSRLAADGLSLPAPTRVPPDPAETAATMLDTRMLFSALVDADFLDTEEHMQDDGTGKAARPEGLPLRPAEALERLERYIDGLPRDAAREVREMRADLMRACREAGRTGAQGVWTLTAPTGAGKTLAMLAFALEQAVAHGLRRIVIVLPFLSIIDQTAGVLRAVFPADEWGQAYVLEHHSLADGNEETTGGGVERDEQDPAARERRQLTENWDAPIIVTTSVQALESLHASRPARCRKLHRLARAVLLFDEVQTLPVELAVPTLRTLSRLADPRYRTTIVFATATQPAFSHLHDAVSEAGKNAGWRPTEIVPADLTLYDRARRTRVDWSRATTPTSWADVAALLTARDQALCVVNLRKHARDLAGRLKDGGVAGWRYLSTDLCPAHRRVLLDAVRADLDAGMPCRLVSTQCIEAGVDIDFPYLLRALGPLEAIAQAAGRCNRHGNLGAQGGEVTVFLPERDGKGALYPPGGYEQAADATGEFLNARGGELDIHDPATFERYFQRLYHLSRANDLPQEWRDAYLTQDFVKAAECYRLIEQKGVNVVVPYDREAFEQLCDEAEDDGLTRDWVRRARPHTVTLFVPRRGGQVEVPTWLTPVRLPRYHKNAGENAPDWYLCTIPDYYDADFGLLPPEGADYLVI